MKLLRIIAAWAMALSLAACSAEMADDTGGHAAGAGSEIVMVDGVKKKKIEGFGGIIAESYDESEEWWPETKNRTRMRRTSSSSCSTMSASPRSAASAA